MLVGARPWQVLYPSEPSPEYDPELEVPLLVRPSLSNTELHVNVDVLPLWGNLPRAIQRISAAIALDMALVNMEGHSVYGEAIAPLEELTKAIINRPHEPLWSESFFVEAFDLIPPEFRDPENPYRNIFDAVEQFFDGLLLNSAISSLITFCYSPLGPLDSLSVLSPNLGNIETAHLFVVYHDVSFYQEFYQESDADELGRCLTHWINIWWQEVVDTLAFVIPESKGRIFRK